MIANEIRGALQKTCSALNKNNVEYIIVGGVAVGYHGYQRISGGPMLDYPEIKHDIDIWYKPTTENFENIIKSIEELGVETTELKEVIFDPLKTYLRIPHTYFKIEFLPQMKGLESFSQSRSKALVQVLDNNRILIINLEDLLTNKAAVDRQIDRTDIKELRKRNPGRSGAPEV